MRNNTSTTSTNLSFHATTSTSFINPFFFSSHTKQQVKRNMRDRATSLSSALFSPFSPDVRKRVKTITKTVSSRSLLVRGKNSYRKTVRNFFGSPNNRNAGNPSALWCESLGENKEAVLKKLSKMETRRQEIIFELTSSEAQYVEDLKNLHKVWVLKVGESECVCV